MLFSLDVIRAGEGDCSILHYGSKDDPRLVLIDGGPSGIYTDFLKVRLQQIKDERGIGATEQLPIKLLMVSHMDDDHLLGILDLTRDLIQDDPTFAWVQSFWHNSFTNNIGDVPPQLTASFTASFTASPGGVMPDLPLDVDRNEKEITASLKLLASVKNGAKLRRDINNDRLRTELNPQFGGDLIMADEDTKALNIGNGLKFTVVGPMRRELERLHAKHQRWLVEMERDGKTGDDVLADYVDKSETNLSSIVVLAEAEGKRILFTGDALGNKVMKGMELVGLIDEGGSMHVDVLKVPHHGSDRNAALNFYQRITADHYIYSGDGQHGNPERQSFEWLLEARGEDDEYTIHLTYPISEIDVAREADWQAKQTEDRRRKLTNPSKVVRPDWSPEEQSLRAFFKAHPKLARKRSIVALGEPHVIDLLEKLGF
jgi:glyoxylase-like metal-dependent hydrolase (beta-lactamase superfamily II)